MPPLTPTAPSEPPPVVFVHTGPSQVIVTACVAQARAAGCKRIFVISDRRGPWALLPGVESFPVWNGDRYGAREFRSVFKNYSSYGAGYAAIIFEKFFALRALFETHKLERLLYLDSDLLLYKPVAELAAIYGGDFTGTDSTADNHETVSPHFLFLTPRVCERICADFLATYGSAEGHERMKALWAHKKTMNPAWGVGEMDFLAFLRDSGEFQFTRVNQGNPRVDASIQDHEGFVYSNGMKVIEFENGLPCGTLEATGERVVFHALHLQGYLKHLVIHYAQVHRLVKKFFYLLWRLEQRGWIKWPRICPPAASAAPGA